MTFKERLRQIEIAEQQASSEPEKQPPEEPAEQGPVPYTEEGTYVHCSECGHNTFREEHDAIMCTNCCHGPFCNYCWQVHVREFHPMLVDSYNDAKRGIRRKARFLNHYLIRTVVKPAGFLLGLAALLAAAYFAYTERGAVREPDSIPAAAEAATGSTVQTPALQVRDSVRPGMDSIKPVSNSTGKLAEQATGISPESQGKSTGLTPVVPAGDPLRLELIALTSPVSRSSTANLTIQSAPGATCTIQVRYRSGPSKAKGLEPGVADESGRVTWKWLVARYTTLGDWPIDIGCELKNASARLSATMTVQE